MHARLELNLNRI